VFEGAARQAIHQLKYRGRHSLVVALVELMVDYWRATPLPVDLLVPVPLHAARQRERGYNQAELLARASCRFAQRGRGIDDFAHEVSRSGNYEQEASKDQENFPIRK